MGSIIVDAGPPVLNPDYEVCVKTAIGGSKAASPCKRTITSLHGSGSLVQFAFADGSTRSISNEIDLNILGAAATMNGGENTETP